MSGEKCVQSFQVCYTLFLKTCFPISGLRKNALRCLLATTDIAVKDRIPGVGLQVLQNAMEIARKCNISQANS